MINLENIDLTDNTNEMLVPIGISNKHLHVSQEDLEALFGEGYQLTPHKPLGQPDQYAAVDVVKLVGKKGEVNNIRILGPVRPQTQVELSQTDCRTLGINAPIRESGDLAGSGAVKIVAPNGNEVELSEGVIIAMTHIHMHTLDGAKMGICDKERVHVVLKGDGRQGIVCDVLARVGDSYALELHLDTDEANAFRVKNGQNALIIKK